MLKSERQYERFCACYVNGKGFVVEDTPEGVGRDYVIAVADQFQDAFIIGRRFRTFQI